MTASPAPSSTAVAVNFGWLWRPFLFHRKSFPHQPHCSLCCQPALHPVRLPTRPAVAAAPQRDSSALPWPRGGGCAALQGRACHISPPAGRLRLPAGVWRPSCRPGPQYRTVSTSLLIDRNQLPQPFVPHQPTDTLSTQLVWNVQGEMFVCLMKWRGRDWERRRKDLSYFRSLIMVPLIILISDWVCFSSCALQCAFGVLVQFLLKASGCCFYSDWDQGFSQ